MYKTTIIYLREFNIYSVIFRLILSLILGCVVGMERGKHGRAAGLRTHILVCIGSTITSLTSLYIYYKLGISNDVSRISAQVISGIGFLGAGTILIRNNSIVTGLTTSACIWATACMGIAIGYGFYEVAIVSTIIIFITTSFLGKIDKEKQKGKGIREISIYVEFINCKLLNNTLILIKEKDVEIINVTPTKSKINTPQSIGTDIIIRVNNQKIDKIINEINDIENVNFAIVTLP